MRYRRYDINSHDKRQKNFIDQCSDPDNRCQSLGCPDNRLMTGKIYLEWIAHAASLWFVHCAVGKFKQTPQLL